MSVVKCPTVTIPRDGSWHAFELIMRYVTHVPLPGGGAWGRTSEFQPLPTVGLYGRVRRELPRGRAPASFLWVIGRIETFSEGSSEMTLPMRGWASRDLLCLEVGRPSAHSFALGHAELVPLT